MTIGTTEDVLVEESPGMTDAQLEKMLPRPVGYHLLVAMPTIQETFGHSEIVKPDQTKQNDSILSMVGLVLDMGKQAYADEGRYPTGPWCQQGDYVMFRANTGTRFKVDGKEYRLMNDDSIEAVVSDPSAITRAY